jgi:hypothetical protein
VQCRWSSVGCSIAASGASIAPTRHVAARQVLLIAYLMRSAGQVLGLGDIAQTDLGSSPRIPEVPHAIARAHDPLGLTESVELAL